MSTNSARRTVLAWASYDWANSAFATTVMAGFFPVFLTQYWSAGADSGKVLFRLGLANGLAGLAIALLAPVLGAIADRSGGKKALLGSFAALGIVMTAGLYFAGRGQWPFAIAMYALATLGFAGGNVFYDSLLVSIAGPKRLDYVSGLGFAAGYLGGGLLFALNVTMVVKPAWFGIADAATAVRLAFLSVAIWWAVFSLPVLLLVPEPMGLARVSGWRAARAGVHQFVATFRHVRHLRTVFLFLVAYWFYIDGVNTVIKMAVAYGLAIGLPSSSLMVALLITQFVGFPAAIAFGYLGERFGPKAGIYVGIIVYGLVTLLATQLHTVAEFYLLAASIGLVQGGIQSLSRSLYARLIPADKEAEFFGFYGVIGKFSAILGPLLLGWVDLVTGDPRLSIGSILILFIVGGVLLMKVDVSEGQALAQALEREV